MICFRNDYDVGGFTAGNGGRIQGIMQFCFIVFWGDGRTLYGVCLVLIVMYRPYDIFEVFQEAIESGSKCGDHYNCDVSYCRCMGML